MTEHPEKPPRISQEDWNAVDVPELTDAEFAAVAMSSAEFGTYMEAEMVKWARVVKEGNIRPQ